MHIRKVSHSSHLTSTLTSQPQNTANMDNRQQQPLAERSKKRVLEVAEVRPLRVAAVLGHFRLKNELILVLKVENDPQGESRREFKRVWVELNSYMKNSIMAAMRIKKYVQRLKPRKLEAIKPFLCPSLYATK